MELFLVVIPLYLIGVSVAVALLYLVVRYAVAHALRDHDRRTQQAQANQAQQAEAGRVQQGATTQAPGDAPTTSHPSPK